MAVRGRNLAWRIRRSTLLLIVSLAASFLGVWALYPLTFPVQTNIGHDFKLLYAAAQMMRAHQNPYDAVAFLHRVVADNVQYVASHGQLTQPYVYPPLFAWGVIPLTYLSSQEALLAWQILSLVCVFLGTLALTSLWAFTPGARFFANRANRVILAALTATAPITLYAVYWGNPVVLVYGAMGGWVWALRRGHARSDVVAGTLMTGALLKPQLALPLAIIAVFCLVQGPDAWVRRRRVALSFGITLVALLTLDLLFTGPSLLLAWRQSVMSLSQMIFYQTDMPSLPGLLQPTLIYQSLRVQQYFLVGIGLLGAATVIYLYCRLYRTWTPGALLALLTLVWCLVSPYGHANDELFYIPGGFAIVSALVAMLGRAASGSTLPKLGLRLRADARVTVQTLAVLVLWCGGAIQLSYGKVVFPAMYLPGHALYVRLAAAIVPLVILAAFIAGWRFHRQRADAARLNDEQSHRAGQEMFLTPVSES